MYSSNPVAVVLALNRKRGGLANLAGTIQKRSIRRKELATQLACHGSDCSLESQRRYRILVRDCSRWPTLYYWQLR